MVELKQEQANYLETFGNLEDEVNKKLALYYITRFGYGYNLTDGDKCTSSAFECSEQLKMVEAVINGYEVFEPKFKFYNFSDSSGTTPLYYAGVVQVVGVVGVVQVVQVVQVVEIVYHFLV